jgi:hypothetical protein
MFTVFVVFATIVACVLPCESTWFAESSSETVNVSVPTGATTEYTAHVPEPAGGVVHGEPLDTGNDCAAPPFTEICTTAVAGETYLGARRTDEAPGPGGIMMAMLTGAVGAGDTLGTGVAGGPPGELDDPPPHPARTTSATTAPGTKRRLNCIRQTPE